MKKIFLAMLIATAYNACAQDTTASCYLFADKVTGRQAWLSKDLHVLDTGGHGFTATFIVIDENNVMLNLALATKEVHCIDDADEINILFRDGSRMTLYNRAGYNCNALSVGWFGDTFGNKKDLRQMIDKQVETIRVVGRGNFEQQDFTKEQSQQLQQMASCISLKMR